MNIFRERIEAGRFRKALVVRRATVFGKIVTLEEERGLVSGEFFDEVGEERVFGEGGIVDDPEIRLKRDQVSQIVSAEIAFEAVVEFGNDDLLLAPVDFRAAGGHDDFVSLIRECSYLRLDYAGDSSAAQVIVDNENEHSAGGVCLLGNMRKAKLQPLGFSTSVQPCPTAQVWFRCRSRLRR